MTLWCGSPVPEACLTFLSLAPFPFQIILCIFFLFPVLCVTPPSITALPSSIPLSPPVCFYVTFVSSLFLHLSSCVVLCNIWSHCRRGETQSHAPNQPNQIHTTPDTEPRRSRTKKNQGRPPVSGSTGNRYFFNLLQSNFPASHLALNCLNQTQ